MNMCAEALIYPRKTKLRSMNESFVKPKKLSRRAR